MSQRSTLRCLIAVSIFLAGSCVLQGQDVSCDVEHVPTDAAAKAYAQHQYSSALQLYSDEVKKNPQDTAAVAGEVRALLATNAVDAAAQIAELNVAAHPKDALLVVALGEVRFRQGDIHEAALQYDKALGLNPCLARLRYDMYQFLWMQSMRASAFKQLTVAYQLMPDDPEIQFAWTNHLPLRERVAAIDSAVIKNSGGTKESRANLMSLDARLHAILSAKSGGCRLETKAATTTLPFVYLLTANDIRRFQGIGFDIRVNGKASARLELDTGASGILLNRVTAKKAGLVPIASDKIWGIGNHDAASGYWAYVDSLQVGGVNFHNCMVEVSDQRSVVGIDGLIGADTFENFHVTMDMPLRQMTLSPLPTRPGEAAKPIMLNAAGVSAATVASGETSAGTTRHPTILYHDPYIAPEMKDWTPFYRFGHEILLPGTLKDRKPRLFLLDSGAYSTCLSIRAAKSIGKIHADYDAGIRGLSGEVDKVYRVDSADLIFANLHDPLRQIVAFNLDGLGNYETPMLSGIIGLDTLMMLTIDIDYRDGLIHLNYDPKHGYNVWTH